MHGALRSIPAEGRPRGLLVFSTGHDRGRRAVGWPGARREHPPRGSGSRLPRLRASLASRSRGGSHRSPRNSLRGFGGPPPRDPRRARSEGPEPHPRFLHRGSCREVARQRQRRRRDEKARRARSRGSMALRRRPGKVLRGKRASRPPTGRGSPSAKAGHNPKALLRECPCGCSLSACRMSVATWVSSVQRLAAGQRVLAWK